MAQDITPPRTIATPPRVLLFFVAILALLNIFVFYYIKQEYYIYTTDFMGYWGKSIQFTSLLGKNVFSALDWMYQSIRTSDYGNLPVFLIWPFNAIFGESRFIYIASILNVYFTLAFAAFYGAYKTMLPSTARASAYLTAMVIGLFVLYPPIFPAVLRGYVDIGGLAIVFLVLYLTLRKPILDQKYREMAIIGLSLALLILFRRWYFIWVVGYFIAVAVDVLIASFPLGKFSVHNAWVSLSKAFLAGITFLGASALIAWPLLKRMIFTNYGDEYKAYDTTGTFFQEIAFFFSRLGLLYFLLFVASVAYLFISSDWRRKKTVLFLSVQLLSSWVLFVRIQDFGVHHFYILAPAILLLTAVFLSEMFQRFSQSRVFIGVAAAGFACLIIQFFFIYSPAFGFLNAMIPVMPKRYFPLVRNNISQIIAMKNGMEDIVTSKTDKIYILSARNSSLSINLLKDLKRSLNEDVAFENQILNSTSIDGRDGFPNQLFQAKYVVVLDPVGNVAVDQNINFILHDIFMNNTGMARSYSKIDRSFDLGGKNTAYVFVRDSLFYQEDIDALSAQIRAMYPDVPKTYTLKPPSELVRQESP